MRQGYVNECSTQNVTGSSRSYFFVVNPNSRGGQTHKKWKKMEPVIKEIIGSDYDSAFADGIGTGLTLTKDAIRNGFNSIIGVGGEGTINEVINGVMNTDKTIPVGFIRSGTVNDFLSENVYNWPDSLTDQLTALKSSQIFKAPLTKVSGDEVRYALNIADAGIGAAVSYDASIKRKLTWIRGQFRYTLLSVMKVFRWKNQPVKVLIDDETIDGELSLMMAGYSKMGGGFQTLPHASLEGLEMAYAIAMDFSRIKMLKLMNTVKQGKHDNSIEGIYMGNASKIRLESNDAILFEVDGEPFSYDASVIDIEGIPHCINLIDHNAR